MGFFKIDIDKNLFGKVFSDDFELISQINLNSQKKSEEKSFSSDNNTQPQTIKSKKASTQAKKTQKIDKSPQNKSIVELKTSSQNFSGIAPHTSSSISVLTPTNPLIINNQAGAALPAASTTLLVSAPLNYLLKVSKSGDGQGLITANSGNINCGSVCEDEYTGGSSIIIFAKPDSNSSFGGWSGACSGLGNCEALINSDILATGAFYLLPSVASPSSQSQPVINHILISEIMAGSDANSNDEFIELYNPTSNPIDLTGWSIKKKSSSGSESTLVSSSRLEGKVIFPNKYLLLANEGGYSGSVFADIFWPKSYSLAYANNAIVIYNSLGETIEEASWTEIPKNQSYERVSWGNSQFQAQVNPSPQNSNSD